MKKSTLFSIFVIAVLIPLTLYLGTLLKGRTHYLISTLMIVEIMLPFFFVFEHRRPQARELVSIAVMCALSVAARVVIQIPNFKPMMGVIIITGIAFGPESGFLTGAVSAFASNFFFSQGPWTPWQMMAYGIGGFLSGILFHKKRPFANRPLLRSVLLSAYGFAAIVLLVGPLLDTCTLFTTGAKLTPSFALAVYASGLPHNLTHGLTTAITVLLLHKPMLEKLDRLKTKYGMMDASPTQK